MGNQPKKHPGDYDNERQLNGFRQRRGQDQVLHSEMIQSSGLVGKCQRLYKYKECDFQKWQFTKSDSS